MQAEAPHYFGFDYSKVTAYWRVFLGCLANPQFLVD